MMQRHVETLFCDDIRHEVGNKLSYIGVYSGVLFSSVFPFTLPKLCLMVKVVTSLDEPLRSLTLRILKNEEILQEIGVNEEQLASVSNATEDMAEKERDGKVRVAQFMLVFSPIHFDEPCVLKVRAQTEDGELKGLGLKVAQAELSGNKLQ